MNGFCGHGKEILSLLNGVKFLYYLATLYFTGKALLCGIK
jgi:hypothetical protein